MIEPPELPSDLEQPPVRRWKVWLALGVTAVAIPVVVIDNLPDDEPDQSPLGGARVVTPASVPDDRPEVGPVKGISVVTSSTTSSTLPITTSTTTIPADA